MGLAAAAVGGLASAGASIYGSSQQAGATKQASNVQQQMFNTLMQNLQPYQQAGAGALSTLQQQLPSLTAQFAPTQAQLAATPGYQFTLQQGLNAVNNSNSAKGWGNSGPGAKGIAQYSQGLASTTYNQQLQNYLAQNSQIYNMLSGVAGMGQNAAAGIGAGAQNLGSQIGSNLISGANATAGGAVGAANSVNNLGSTAMLYSLLGSNAQNPYGSLGSWF